MLNFSEITEALEGQIESYLAGLASPSATRYFVKRSEYINHNKDKTPWIGIYRGNLSYEPRSIGNSLCNWRAIPRVRVVVQGASTRSGEEAENHCENYTQEVLEAILSDYTIGGTVETITGFDIESTFDRESSKRTFFHMNIITVTLQAKSGRAA